MFRWNENLFRDFYSNENVIVVRMKVMKIVDSLAVDNVENDRIIR